MSARPSLVDVSREQMLERPLPHSADVERIILAGPLLHFVYSSILRRYLGLDAGHARVLSNLGFDCSRSPVALYRSGPSTARDGGDFTRLVVEGEMNRWEELGSIFAPDVAVPGLYFDGRLVRLNLRPGSLAVPVCDGRRYIVALQLYRGPTDPLPRWFESQGLPRGARAHRAPHFARPDLARRDGRVTVCEHTLEADLTSWRSGVCAVAVNRVMPDLFARAMRRALPEVSACTLALDLPDVELLRALCEQGFDVLGSREVAA